MKDKKFTAKTAENAKATGKPYQITTCRGFYLYVSAGGGKCCRYNYRYNDKKQTETYGKYPGMPLAEATKVHEEFKNMLASGVNPKEEKETLKAESLQKALDNARTFELVGKEWLEKFSSDYASSTLKKKLLYFERFTRVIGNIPIKDITPAVIVDAIRPVEENLSVDGAHKMAELANQICRYAQACGYCVFNAAYGISRALKPVRHNHYACLTNPAAIGALLRCIDSYKAREVSVLYALKIIPYVPLRTTEFRGAYWQEIDFENAVWTVPAYRAKRPQDGGGMKSRQAHSLPLSNQVLKLMTDLKHFGQPGPLCFPGRGKIMEPITDNGLLSAIRRIGYGKEEMTVHGFRGTFSSLLNEKKLEWGFDGDVIEAQLAHKEKNAIRGAYNHAGYMEQRRRMMQLWANYLDELRDNNF